MDNKYNVPKPKKPETKSEILEQEIRDLVKRRDGETSAAVKQKLNQEITKLFAQYERLKL